MTTWQAILVGALVGLALVVGGHAHARITALTEEVASQSVLIQTLQARLTAMTPQQRDVAATADSWRESMQAEPEGSPRYLAFEARLRRIGAI